MTKCCVCGQQVACTQLKSTCSDKILSYCPACLQSGFESYEELVSFGFLYDNFSPSMINKILNPSLRYYRKSIEQFNEDVLKQMEGD